MLRVGFEPTIPVFDRSKAIHALDRALANNTNIKKHDNGMHYVPFTWQLPSPAATIDFRMGVSENSKGKLATLMF
jgi:hypothetical protein